MTNIYKLALKKWGNNSQIMMAIEEMSELTKELSKSYRGKCNADQVREEMADVEIMLTQLKMIFGDIRFIKDKKLVRLAKTLKEFEEL